MTLAVTINKPVADRIRHFLHYLNLVEQLFLCVVYNLWSFKDN